MGRNIHHFLYIDATNDSTICIRPGPNSDELCRNWQRSLKYRLIGHEVYLGVIGHDVSVCGSIVTVEAKNGTINSETLELVRRITLSTSLQDLSHDPIVLPLIPETEFEGVEIYFNNGPPSIFSMCVSLDLRDLNIDGIEMDLRLCDSNNIVVIKRNKNELPSGITFNMAIERVLKTINSYQTTN